MKKIIGALLLLSIGSAFGQKPVSMTVDNSKTLVPIDLPQMIKIDGYGFLQSGKTNNVEVGTYTDLSGGWIGTKSKHSLHFFTGGGSKQMTLSTAGNIGIGTATPTDKLTVVTPTNSTGITQTDGTVSISTYVGTPAGTGNGWGLGGWIGTKSNHPLYLYTNNGAPSVVIQSGNVGIGVLRPAGKLDVSGKSVFKQETADAAVEINGAIKVAGNKPAFVIIADKNNLTDVYDPEVNYTAAKYYMSVIIDNPMCNEDPLAILTVTQQAYPGTAQPLSVYYDSKLKKWKISINPDGIEKTSCYGLASRTSGSNCGSSYAAVMPWDPKQIDEGDKFNVLVIKQNF